MLLALVHVIPLVLITIVLLIIAAAVIAKNKANSNTDAPQLKPIFRRDTPTIDTSPAPAAQNASLRKSNDGEPADSSSANRVEREDSASHEDCPF